MWRKFVSFDSYARPEQQCVVERILDSYGENILYSSPLHLIIHRSAPNTEFGAPEAQYKADKPPQIRLSPSFFTKPLETQEAVLFHELMHYEMTERYPYDFNLRKLSRYNPQRNFEIAVSFILGEVLGWAETFKRFPNAALYYVYYGNSFANLFKMSGEALQEMNASPRFEIIAMLRSFYYLLVVLALHDLICCPWVPMNHDRNFLSPVLAEQYRSIYAIIRNFIEKPYSLESISLLHDELRVTLQNYVDATVPQQDTSS